MPVSPHSRTRGMYSTRQYSPTLRYMIIHRTCGRTSTTHELRGDARGPSPSAFSEARLSVELNRSTILHFASTPLQFCIFQHTFPASALRLQDSPNRPCAGERQPSCYLCSPPPLHHMYRTGDGRPRTSANCRNRAPKVKTKTHDSANPPLKLD